MDSSCGVKNLLFAYRSMAVCLSRHGSPKRKQVFSTATHDKAAFLRQNPAPRNVESLNGPDTPDAARTHHSRPETPACRRAALDPGNCDTHRDCSHWACDGFPGPSAHRPGRHGTHSVAGRASTRVEAHPTCRLRPGSKHPAAEDPVRTLPPVRQTTNLQARLRRIARHMSWRHPLMIFVRSKYISKSGAQSPDAAKTPGSPRRRTDDTAGAPARDNCETHRG